jgi:hypothetical protein
MKDLKKKTTTKQNNLRRKQSTTLGEVVDRKSSTSSWTSSVLSSFNNNSTNSKPPPDVPVRTRSELLYDVLMRDTIDIDRLASFCFSGVPDCDTVRRRRPGIVRKYIRKRGVLSFMAITTTTITTLT